MAQVTGNPHDAAPESFGVPLCAADGAGITHWAAHTRVRDATLAALPQLAAAVPGALWVVTAHDDDTPQQRAGRPTVGAWLTAQELAPYTPEEDQDE